MAVDCGQAKKIAVALEQPRVIRLGQARHRLNESIEYRLQVESRPADDLEHISGGGLLLQRFAQIAIARLQLSKQAHVLDRDNGLIGERPQQINLTIREGAWCPTGNRDNADGAALVDHRHTNDSSQPDPAIRFSHRWFQLLGVDVRNMDNRGIDKRARRHRRLTARDLWKEVRRRVSRAGSWIMLRGEVKEFAVEARDDGILAAAQPTGASNNGVEDRLDIRGRARDHTQNVARRCLLL